MENTLNYSESQEMSSSPILSPQENDKHSDIIEDIDIKYTDNEPPDNLAGLETIFLILRCQKAWDVESKKFKASREIIDQIFIAIDESHFHKDKNIIKIKSKYIVEQLFKRISQLSVLAKIGTDQSNQAFLDKFFMKYDLSRGISVKKDVSSKLAQLVMKLYQQGNY